MSPLVDVAPIEMDEPLQIEVELATVAEGNGFTVILTLSVLLQPVAVIVSVKV